MNEIDNLIIRNNKDRKPYICGLLLNEMMLTEYLFTLQSPKSTRKTVSERFQKSLKELDCSLSELRQYHYIVKTNNGIRLLETIYLLSHGLGVNGIVTPFMKTVLNIYYCVGKNERKLPKTI